MKAPFILLTAFTVSVHGQTVIQNIFDGTNGPDTNLTALATVLAGDTDTGPIGPGWNGTVTLPLGVIFGLSMDLNEGNSGALEISGSGAVGVAGTFSANKTFTSGAFGAPFIPGELYALELNVDSAATLGVLGSYTVSLAIDGTGVSNSTGQGLLGAADVLGLFGGTDTAILYFRAPQTINTQNLSVSIAGGNVAGIAGSGVTFTNGAIYAVPEPGVTAMAGVFALGLIASRRRR